MSDLFDETVGTYGCTVRVQEETFAGQAILKFSRPNGSGYDRESLGYGIRGPDGEIDEDARNEALDEAQNLSSLLRRGKLPEEATEEDKRLGEIVDLYRREVLPEKKPYRRRELDRGLELWERFLGRDFDLGTFSEREWTPFKRQRRSGEIDSRGHRVHDEDKRREVSKATLAHDLKTLRQLCRWAKDWRAEGGDFLITTDPTSSIDLPSNEDPRRPVCSDELLEGLREKAPEVTRRVRGDGNNEQARTCLPELLDVVAGTGARIGAVLELEWRDWDPDDERTRYGSLTWRGEHQKNSKTRITPVPESVRGALQRQRQQRPGVARAPIFPAPDSDGHLRVDVALNWLQDAEKAARGHHVTGFGWHALRRRWANKMKERSAVDAAALGGWSDPAVMEEIYQRATVEDMDRALEAGDPGRAAS